MNKLTHFLVTFFLTLVALPASALDIIYPQKAQYITRADETYVLGNINKGATLKINNEDVKIWDKQIFCHIVSLKDGVNEIIIEETLNNDVIKKIYKINKIVPSKNSNISATAKPAPPQVKYFKNLMFGKIISDNAPVRDNHSEYANRVTHLPKDTNVLIEAEFGNWNKIYTNDKNDVLWIFNKNIEVLYPVNNRYTTYINDAVFTHDKTDKSMKLKLDFPVPFKLKENNNSVEITLWGIQDISKLQKMISKQKTFKNLNIKKCENDNLTIEIPSDGQLWGYDAIYENNVFVFKKRNKPKINPNHPLANMTITIDAGHGGNEKGTIGPGRIPEKDVNLAISLKLKKELENSGAKVIMTRDTDTEVGIYQRPQIAKNSNSLISLSIHANSMVDGNPYKNHGVETYYYNRESQKLADIIKKQMVYQLGLNDNGTKSASFVLTRPTMPLSVLIETAYMPNPEEYLKLTNDKFQTQVAKSIAQGLKNYMILQSQEDRYIIQTKN